jgi:hypothetical protein
MRRKLEGRRRVAQGKAPAREEVGTPWHPPKPNRPRVFIGKWS